MGPVNEMKIVIGRGFFPYADIQDDNIQYTLELSLDCTDAVAFLIPISFQIQDSDGATWYGTADSDGVALLTKSDLLPHRN